MASKSLPRTNTVEIKHDARHTLEILEHHGIKGMRWGVRRSRGSDGTVGGSDNAARARKAAAGTARGAGKVARGAGKAAVVTGRAGKKVASKANAARKNRNAEKKIREVARRGGVVRTSSLSDEQLKSLVSRMSLEQQYAKLTAQPEKKKNAGVQFVKGLVIAQGKRQATAIFNKKTDERVAELLKTSAAKKVVKEAKAARPSRSSTESFADWQRRKTPDSGNFT